jgi:aminopeptidase
VFTTPDPARTEGTVSATKPLLMNDGTMVRDLVVRFEHGSLVDLQASEGGERLRTMLEGADGAVRLGEAALVDRESRIGQRNTIFYDGLIDENAASHFAFGQAYMAAVEDPAEHERANSSVMHLDFMIGSDDVAVTGITGDGERVPVLRGGVWQLGRPASPA